MLRDQLSQALKDALRAQEKRKVATLRLIMAAIKDRDIAGREDGRRDLVGDEDILQILQKMVRQRRESIETYERAGRLELAEQEREEIVIIEEFLPRQLSEPEIEAEVRRVVDELDCKGLKDMGRIMSMLRERHAGTMDFGKASAVAKGLLC